MHHGVGDPQTPRFGHLLDAVGMEIAVILLSRVARVLVPIDDGLDDLDQFPVAPIEQQTRRIDGLDPEARGDMSREEGESGIVTRSNSMSFAAQAALSAQHRTLCI